MGFDEQPDDDPHGLCREEIRKLEAEIERLRLEVRQLAEYARIADASIEALGERRAADRGVVDRVEDAEEAELAARE